MAQQDVQPPVYEATPPGVDPTHKVDESALLNDLRAILVAPDRRRLDEVEADVVALQRRIDDPDALAAAVSPILGDAIRRSIRESRDEMIEALYPIIGQLITRAVAESIRELARVIDSRMRTSISPALVLRRLRARLRGVPEETLLLRDAFPFQVREVFLIHRETGLLLTHLPEISDRADNSDLVSGMLTAIRDFVADAFGQGGEGSLDEIQYGDQCILLEATRHAYLAVVVEGIEPAGLRSVIRDHLMAIENDYQEVLTTYDGNAARLIAVDTALTPLLARGANGASGESAGLTGGQKRIVAGLAAGLLLCGFGACAGVVVAGRNALNRPAYTVVVTATPGPTNTPTLTYTPTATATETPTLTPTMTATATATSTRTPTATHTATPRPTPFVIVQQGNAYMRLRPNINAAVIGYAEGGRTYTVLSRDKYGAWLQICCARGDRPGWISSSVLQIEGELDDIPVYEAK